MSLESKIKKRNKGLRTVRAGTAAVAVGGVACSGVIAVGLAAQSGALNAPTTESVDTGATSLSNSPSVRSVVGVDKARKVKKKPVVQPKPAPTPPAPAPAPQPNNNNNNNGNSKPAKSNGS